MVLFLTGVLVKLSTENEYNRNAVFGVEKLIADSPSMLFGMRGTRRTSTLSFRERVSKTSQIADYERIL